MLLDHWVAALLVPLSFWVLLNGIDDLIIDLAAIAGYIRQAVARHPGERVPDEAGLLAAPPRRMAIFVAAWKEQRVIQRMIENNVTKLRYPRFDFFVGVYPNDSPTQFAVREAMKSFPNVHLAVCPHPGPTSKADCLNWIYQRMLLYEEEHDVRFEMVVTHDAEDLIDPDALLWINYFAQWNDMVQIPVLALRTPPLELSHGVYCDEFAEYQFKDMVARQFLGGFIPSNGVGTGFSRNALARLAAEYSNRVFEPASLTEDYENGFRIGRMGMGQKFIPIRFSDGRPVATREFFPRKLQAAVRQRSRWMMGITLQSWEFHSAADNLRHLYWFWRDRKGLVGNLVTPLTNLLFLYGLITLLWSRATGTAWGLANEARSISWACMAGLSLQATQTSVRAWCSSRVYGWRFAAAVPLRVLTGNWINCLATCNAIATYARARLRRHPLRWAKTEHAYPNRAALLSDRRRLGEILTGSQWLDAEALETALRSKPENRRLGEHLLSLGLITEAELYAALSVQNSLPLGKPAPEEVSLHVVRSLPAALSHRWKLLPFRIVAGELYVAAASLPQDQIQQEIRRFSSLEVRFHLVTPAEFSELAEQYLG